MINYRIIQFLFACSVPLTTDEAENERLLSNLNSNYVIGSYGLYVILIAILIHLIVNKIVLKRFLTFSLILYALLIFMHFHFKATSDMGDCGMMYRDSTTYFAILSGFWIIFAPLTMYSVKKYRKYLKDKNSSKPFADPIDSLTSD